MNLTICKIAICHVHDRGIAENGRIGMILQVRVETVGEEIKR